MPRIHLAIFAGVLAAALGLAWLAWRSLDSRRVLLVQGAAETRRREAEAGAHEWQEGISGQAAPLLALLTGTGAPAQTLAALEQKPGVAAAFALDRAGRLTWPPRPQARLPYVEELPGDGEARRHLEEGYAHEFHRKNPAAALASYIAATDPRFGRSVRVEALLQAGALSATLDDPVAALRSYSRALELARFASSHHILLARVEVARLRGLESTEAREREVLGLLEECERPDAAMRFGEALPAARARAEAMAADLTPSPDAARRRGELLEAGSQRRLREAAREQAQDAVSPLLSRAGEISIAALPGRRIAAWRLLGTGGCAGIVLLPEWLPASPVRIVGDAEGWRAEEDGVRAAVPAAAGLWAFLPPSNAAAVEIGRQRIWLGASLAALLAALAAGLGLSFRAVKREAELAQLKSDFVATVSHELKTPLALVRMYAETLTLGRVDGEDRRREYLDVILRESERLTGMIERILDFARIERGESAWRPVPGDLAAAVRGITQEYAARHSLDVEIEAPSPARASFDPEAVALVVRNLLENAARYGEGSPAITVRVDTRGGTVRVVVEDRGIGVPPGERARIFERFYRAGDPRARRVKGTGLGLALVAGVMEGHGGRARCEGRDGGGSRFVLEFPVAEGRR